MVPAVSRASVGSTSSDTSPSAAAGPSGTAGSEGVAGGLHVVHRERLEDLARLHAQRGQVPDVLVVERARRHRLLEDGGVRGHAEQAVLGDQPVELAAGDQVAGDEVVPGALSQLAQARPGDSGS